jgi:hypothetical protein
LEVRDGTADRGEVLSTGGSSGMQCEVVFVRIAIGRSMAAVWVVGEGRGARSDDCGRGWRCVCVRIQECVVLPVIFLGSFRWEVNCNSKCVLRVL